MGQDLNLSRTNPALPEQQHAIPGCLQRRPHHVGPDGPQHGQPLRQLRRFAHRH
ncbi:MAG: hypothetical protein WKG07_21965 [Hymenobacter sp.]